MALSIFSHFNAQNFVDLNLCNGIICKPNSLHLGLNKISFRYFACRHIIEPRHEISNNVVCVISKASDQSARKRSLIRVFASRLNIL